MSQSDGPIADNIPLRRLPSIRGGVTVIWLENPGLSLADGSAETIVRLRALKNCYILRYTTVLKCIKYLKRARSYESIIMVIVINDADAVPKEVSAVTSDISRLSQYRQVRSILIVSPTTKEIASDIKNDSLTNIQKDTGKWTGIFHDHESVFFQLQQLISETEESDDGLFSLFNQREKSLRDVHHELGAFVWSHSYRGQCSFLTKCILETSRV